MILNLVHADAWLGVHWKPLAFEITWYCLPNQFKISNYLGTNCTLKLTWIPYFCFALFNPDIDPCILSTYCLNGSTCRTEPTGSFCQCPDGLTGKKCGFDNATGTFWTKRLYLLYLFICNQLEGQILSVTQYSHLSRFLQNRIDKLYQAMNGDIFKVAKNILQSVYERWMISIRCHCPGAVAFVYRYEKKHCETYWCMKCL